MTETELRRDLLAQLNVDTKYNAKPEFAKAGVHGGTTMNVRRSMLRISYQYKIVNGESVVVVELYIPHQKVKEQVFNRFDCILSELYKSVNNIVNGIGAQTTVKTVDKHGNKFRLFRVYFNSKGSVQDSRNIERIIDVLLPHLDYLYAAQRGK